MSSRRVLKAAQAIREVISMSILTDIKDPRVKNVTVTFVEVSGDLRQAKVHVSVMGSDKEKQLCLNGLQHAAGFLQKKVGNRIDTRYTPRVSFELDKGLDHAMTVTRILQDVLPKEESLEDTQMVETDELVDDQQESVESDTETSENEAS